MGTRAIIAKIERDGTGKRVLLVYDGYPTWAGVKLIRHYNDEKTIDTLIGLGNIYTLSDSPEHTPGSYLKWGESDNLWDVTRTFGREGKGNFPEYPPEAVSGGLEGVCAEIEGPPYTYIWTPDGWFASYPVYTPDEDDEDYEDDDDVNLEQRFVPLLTLIHDYHFKMYSDCQAGPPDGPYRIRCTVHCHTIQPLQDILPKEMMPKDANHPTYRLFPDKKTE